MRQGGTGRWIVGISGASGATYGVTLVHALLERGYQVELIITDAGWRVLHDELGWNAAKRSDMIKLHWPEREGAGKLVYHPIQDIGATIASGSYLTDGMAIVPCSMGSLSAIAHGGSSNLLQRAADVMLKEGRRLVIMPRETPLSAIHLENMLKLSRLGVAVVPAMPAYYNKPETIDDIVRYMVGKTLDAMGVDNDMYSRWGASDGERGR